MASRRRPIVIRYEEGDEMTHSVEKPICDDDTCICAMCEYEILANSQKPSKPKRPHRKPLVEQQYDVLSARLNGDRSFRLLR